MQRDPADGSYLILTSLEASHDDRAGHAGHLFRVPGAALEGDGGGPARPLPAPLAAYRAKAEGLAVLPGGKYLAVMDDDNDGWKELFAGYGPTQGLFEVTPAR